jgi:hypothetical protein
MIMNKKIQATIIGGLAQFAIETGHSGSVVGITSKGIFINSEDKIIFLTGAGYKSPFNIKVGQIELLSNNLNLGGKCLFEGNSITFPHAQIKLDLQQAMIWRPENPKKITCSWEQQIDRIDLLIKRMLEIDPSRGWLFLKDFKSIESVDQDSTHNHIKRNTDAFIAKFISLDLQGCLDAARSIIGLGGGLTPSGDDWLAGFILLLTRVSQARCEENPFVVNLGKSLTEMAIQKTTKISANRMEAACIGWSEELFLDLIDHIITIDSEFGSQKISLLINFGHSSGVDTSLGIFAAVSARVS